MKNVKSIVIILFLTHTYSGAQDFEGWEFINRGLACNSIDFINDKVGWIAGKGMLLKTEDGGETWESLSIDPYWNITAIDFINENTGWCSGYQSMYEGQFTGKTVNGGETWITSEYLGEIIHAVNEKVVYIDFHKTMNGGETWIDIKPEDDWRTQRLRSMWHFGPDSVIIAGREDWWNDAAQTYALSGVIYKTHNGGESWWRKQAFTNIIEFDNLQFINDSTGYFLAVDENWKGSVCYTTDAFETWRIITPDRFNIASFSLIDHHNICAVVCDSLWNYCVMISNNEGNTWEQKEILPGGWVDYKINYFDSNLGYLNLTIGAGRGGILGEILFRSTDGGSNWMIPEMTYPLKDIYFTDKNTGFVSGGASEWHGGWGNLFKTNDGGRTWINAFQSQDEVKSVFFDANVGYILSTHTSAGKYTTIYKTTNSGNSWNEIYADDGDSIGFYFAGNAMCFTDINNGWVAGAGFNNDSSGAAFLYTGDGGASWDVSWICLDSEYQHHVLNDLHFLNGTHGWAIGENGLIVKYTEHDQWQVQEKISNLPLTEVFFSDEDHGWISGGFLNEEDFHSILLKTIDGGITWQEERNFNYIINDFYFEDNLNGFAVGNDNVSIDRIGSWQPSQGRGVILKTNDGGENWTAVVENLPSRLTALHFKDGIGWAAGETGMILRTDDGSTWIDPKTNEVYPGKFRLATNYPNPFSSLTTIRYQLPEPGYAELTVYNMTGQKIATLAKGKHNPGSYSFDWDATGFANGIYFYLLQVNNDLIQTGKMSKLE